MSSQTFFGRIGLWEQQRWPWIVISAASASGNSSAGPGS